MKQQSCWAFYVFKRPQVSPLEKQRNLQHDIRRLITNTWAKRVAIVSFVITRYLTLTSIGQSSFNLQNCSCSVHHLLFLSLPVASITFIRFCLIIPNSVSALFDLLCSTIQCSIIRLYSVVYSVLIPEL